MREDSLIEISIKVLKKKDIVCFFLNIFEIEI